MTSKREYGIDLLRILSMMGIVGVHILGAGGATQPAFVPTATGMLLNLLDALMIPSVNIFAMITGYFYAARRQIRSGNLIGLLVNLHAYSALFTVVLFFLSSSFLTDFTSIAGSLFPVITGAYWYLVCYVFVFLVMPWLNRLLQSLHQKQYAMLLALLFVLLSLLPTISGRDYFVLQGGYSPFWLIYCYLIGGYLRLHRQSLSGILTRSRCLWLLAADVVVVCVSYYLACHGLWPREIYQRLGQFISPLAVIGPVCLMLCFLDVSISGVRLQKAVISASSAAFDVYVVHCHNYFYDIFIRGQFDFLQDMNPAVALCTVLAIIVLFYLACWPACLIRKWIFRRIGADAAVGRISGWIDARMDALWAQ